MPTYDEPSEDTVQTPLQRELILRKHTVRELRSNIAQRQEELRIALALLAAIKKLNKGGK